jgi:hypothetical protein
MNFKRIPKRSRCRCDLMGTRDKVERCRSNLEWSSRAMPLQIIMDATGDTRHSFDLTDDTAVADAERRFRMLTEKGYRAVRLAAGQTGVMLKKFDPTADETLFIPALQGG